ncbi:MAG TPA: hypothetical protein VMZ28_00885 [Kofleriaceae bacterium]|nr:hypothetical protein [Kofleriaceae bacterium]
MSRLFALLPILLVTACGGDDGGGGGNPDAAPDTADAAPDGPTEIELTTYVGGSVAPLELVAAQDGDGAWQLLESDNGVYSFETAGRYGLAHVCMIDTAVELHFSYATAAEESSPTRTCPTNLAAEGTTVNVSVSNMAGDTQARVFVGHLSDFATVGDPNVALTPLPAARYDAWATVRADGTTIDSAMVERDVQTSTDGPAAVAFDVDTDTFDTTDFSIEIDGAGDDTTEWGAYLWSTRRTLVNLAQPAVDTYAGFPASALEDNDVHQVVVQAVNGDSTGFRATWSYAIDPANVTLTLPPAFGDVSVDAVDTTPYVRVAMTWDAWEGATQYHLEIGQEGERTLFWEATDGWLGEAASYTWEQPDLGDLDGWTNGWALADNVEAAWFAGAHRSSIDPHLFDEPSPPADLDGMTRDLVRTLGSTTP